MTSLCFLSTIHSTLEMLTERKEFKGKLLSHTLIYRQQAVILRICGLTVTMPRVLEN
jgi:hypothetical protein